MDYSYKGKILISTPDISTDIFSRSVVLIVEHDENGAFGIILNKKEDTVSQSISEVFGFPVDIYEGGPVEHNKIFFIVKGTPVTELYISIDEQYYLTEDSETIIEEMVNKRLGTEEVKVFSGYSGWTAKQLEGEIQKKFWTVVEVYNLEYTAPSTHHLWKNIMQNLGGEFLIWANAPENISMN